MFDWVLILDTNFFFLINKSMANSVFDVVMPFITNDKNFRIPILLVWIGLIIFGGKRGRIAAALIIPLIILTDYVSSSVIKPLVERIRPCNALEGVRLLVSCSKAFSFTSSHATNIFGAAFFFSRLYPKTNLFVFIFAGMVGYSRSYVGVHYPFDVICGGLLGIFLAWLILFTYQKITSKYFLKYVIE